MMRDSGDTAGLIHRFEPAEPDGPAAALVLLHGTGGDEHDLVPLGRMLAPGAALLSPRGAVLENGAPRFFRRLAEGVFDIDDLVRRTHDLAAFLRASIAKYDLDGYALFAAGFSNGANIAASLLLLHPGLLRVAVLFRAMVPLEPERTPDLTGTSVFLSSGRVDPMVRAENAERLGELLRQAGADVTHVWQPSGHALARADIEAARDWLHREIERAAAEDEPPLPQIPPG